MKPLTSPFPESKFLENLLFDSDRATYNDMTADQKRLIRFAFYYGYLMAEETKKETR